MAVDRRDFLKTLAVSTGGCLLGTTAAASEEKKSFAASSSMLNDCARCVGCRACQTACRDHYGLDASGDGSIYDMAVDLEDNHYTVIKLYRNGKEYSFVKRQCMHCNYPSCASACPVGALAKQHNGAITYDKDKCIGCRYCMVACPFNIPRFEYSDPLPEIKKCSFCYERLEGGLRPVCVDTCPAGAIAFGTRDEMLTEAGRRLGENPGRYVPHIYGEREVGGTSVLYLSEVPFEKLGLQPFDDEPLPELCEDVQQGLFKYFAPPLGLLALLGLIHVGTRNNGRHGKSDKEGEIDG